MLKYLIILDAIEIEQNFQELLRPISLLIHLSVDLSPLGSS